MDFDGLSELVRKYIRKTGVFDSLDRATKSKTNWDKLNAMKDEDIDLSDAPELSDEAISNGIILSHE